jgi:hypothetical protein
LIDEVEYCGGWDDFENMGIACVCTYSFCFDEYKVFFKDGLGSFCQYLLENGLSVSGYNISNFDLPLLMKHEDLCSLPKYGFSQVYDLFRQICLAAGQDPNNINKDTLSGYDLDTVSRFNIGTGETFGEPLPQLYWHKDKYWETINYCLNNVKITKELIDLVVSRGFLFSPKERRVLHIYIPGRIYRTISQRRNKV